MKCKLNITDPWESGTEKSIEADILNYTERQFLLFVIETIKVKGDEAHYFVCKFKTNKARDAFSHNLSGTYEISMVFDKNINNKKQEIPDIESYRGNFLSGEIII